jgi:hypothetical protein
MALSQTAEVQIIAEDGDRNRRVLPPFLLGKAHRNLALLLSRIRFIRLPPDRRE